MKSTPETLSISLPLTLSMLKEAKKVSEITPYPSQKQAIYLNYLAVKVVHFYCQCMGIETKLSPQDKWHYINQAVFDEAKLELNTGDILECRPILPNQTSINLPLETQSHRVGYMLVEIDQEKRLGSILGFSFPREQTTLERTNIGSLRDFLQFCQRFSLSPQDYLEKLFQGEWQHPEEVLVPDYRRIRSSSATKPQQQEPTIKVRHAKIINLNQRKLALIVHLTWKTANQIDFYARVHPMDTIKTLPLNLQFDLRDSEQNILVRKSTTIGDNCLRLSHSLPHNHQLSFVISDDNQEIIHSLGINQ